MSPVPRRATTDEDKAARRAQILAAAKEVFAAAGYHATTMADVARAAGVSYGAVYWYFPSKEELFAALMDTEAAALRDHIAAAVLAAGSPDLRTVLRVAVTATFEFFEADRDAVRLLFRDALAFGGGVERHLLGIYERFIAELREVIARARDAGEIRDVPPEVVAFSLAALIGQLAHRRLTTDDGLSAAEIAGFVTDLVLDGLRPRD